MPHRARPSGRVGVTILLLLVVAALAYFLVVADPLGLGLGVHRKQSDTAYEDIDPAALPGSKKAPDGGRGTALQGRYGEGDLGAVRLRLLEVADKSPIAGQSLLLTGRRGSEETAVSGEDGVAVFSRLVPDRSYRIQIEVPDHAPLRIQGVKVVRGETTDLGDILVGLNVVVRGRVIDPSGRPVPGSTVSVFTPHDGLLAEGFMASMSKQVSSFPPALEAQTTDGDGWFALQSLGAGTYRVVARHGGYATRFEDDVVVSEDRPARDLTIVLGDGATMKGKVMDDGGKPVAGARVVAVKDTGGRRFMANSATLERDFATTADDGTYAIDTLMRGISYRFGVLADGYSTVYEMNPVEIEREIQTHDFTLVEGGSITGQVVRQADDLPVADATVLVAVGHLFGGRRGGGSGSGDANDISTQSTRTDAEGRFVLQNVLPGPVMSAQVRADGYVPYEASLRTGNTWGEVEAGGALEVPPIQLAEGGTIQGVVADAKTGEALPRARVMVVPPQRIWQVLFAGAPQTQANDKGEYVVTGVPPGDYGVVASAPGYAASDAAAETNAVTVGDAGGSVTLDVVLQRASAVTGLVTDSKGEPVAGARVRTRVAPDRGENGRGRGRGTSRFAALLPGGSGSDLTDQDGRYVIQNVSPDRPWIVTAEADEYVPSESEPFEVEVGETKEMNVVLLGGGNLAGRVVDDRGRFVESARVRVGHIPDDRVASQGRLNAWQVDRYLEPTVYFTDADGKFLARGLPPGRAVVKVESDGFVTYYKRNAEIRADETTSDYVVTLSRGETMAGVVKGASGGAVSGALVALTKGSLPGQADGQQQDDGSSSEADDEIEPRLTSRTDRDGKFEIEHVPPGEYSVVVWFAPGYQTWGRERNEKAIKRNVGAATKNVEFRLEAAVDAGGGGFPGRGGGNRGGR